VADASRGRALTVVMSVTLVLAGVGNVVAGAVIGQTGVRAVWLGAAAFAIAGAAFGYVLARRAPEGDAATEPRPAEVRLLEPESEPDWALWANWAS
jgi:hypothetical protein